MAITIQKIERKITVSQGTRDIRFTKPNRVIEVNSVGRRGPQGISGAAGNAVYNEVPAGAMNNSNITFTTEFDYRPTSTLVHLNGLRQSTPDDICRDTTRSDTHG